ncbi:MAG: tetratricopeptide repeat protein [Verrucomicrobiales bacterium]|nr:tetratricopeptide repeat protein [Verrucomicrobiales bacterium]
MEYLLAVENVSMPGEERKRKSEALADKGFECLADGDYDAALDITRELEALRFSAAFDIGAQAHTALGNTGKAIETLQRGVATAPACWLNWQLLGNYQSDAGDHEKAADAYERALGCPDVWTDSVRLNQAIMANRRGDHARALAHLGMVRDPRLSLECAAARMDALSEAGRNGEALSLADDYLSKKWDEERSKEPLAHIAAARGRIRLDMGVPSHEVRRAVMDAIDAFGSHEEPAVLIMGLRTEGGEQSR